MRLERGARCDARETPPRVLNDDAADSALPADEEGGSALITAQSVKPFEPGPPHGAFIIAAVKQQTMAAHSVAGPLARCVRPKRPARGARASMQRRREARTSADTNAPHQQRFWCSASQPPYIDRSLIEGTKRDHRHQLIIFAT